jgi:hypothetical protein
MSKEAAEHHLKSAEHYKEEARHHREAAKRHEEGQHLEALDDKRSANGHLNAALFHAALAEAIEHSKTSPAHAQLQRQPI